MSLIDNERVTRTQEMVPMRDGIRLATDIYLPARFNGALPVLLERTPYDKRGTNHADRTAAEPTPVAKPEIAAQFAKSGYAYVLQDCRGRFRSEGNFAKYLGEDRDGTDTLAWLLKQPWCNGQVATLGLSYGAHVQAAMAANNPPGLAAMFLDSGGFSNAFQSGIRQNGAFELKQLTWAYKHARLAPETAADPIRRAALAREDIEAWMWKGPWQIGSSPLSAAPEYERFIIDQWHHELFDDFWRNPALWSAGYYDSFADVPTVFMASWYDPYARSAVENFTGLHARKRGPIRLVMGPWTHGQRSVSFSGDVDFGVAAPLDGNLAPDHITLRKSFFDKYVRLLEVPDYLPWPVTYFVMGGGTGKKLPSGRLDHGGRWTHSATWPPSEAKPRTFYLAPGELSANPLRRDEMIELRSNPNDPVPTVGGAFASGSPVMEAGAYDQREAVGILGVTMPGRALADRADVLSFETAPLTEPICVAGTPKVHIAISSSARDADLAIRLIDVHPESPDYPLGYAMNLTHGILRLRFRDGYDSAKLMEPGVDYDVEVELFPTANLFAAGHRIRIEVAGSNFPFFDINPNTGAPAGVPSDPVVAISHIRMGGVSGSRIVLPILERS